ncbi:polyprenyl synthetase family protein [Pseudoduganella plicata]|uniref:(2E,6E)-farnesyl diphosphate synthase n=1 Tax=Pseudoduganella plicata TaxID=321984 RepID=A0A4P7BHM7_9BURK|nr:polyprenyl synthetase family protein [Pseudoduganella plicata]QBQ37820.1 polyprenyl synthetase family protein [Pseudoduganella plicata]GGY93330.1 (2E,6E)-farnesyl diphosphate synthase [Pseudoduganella plicata]
MVTETRRFSGFDVDRGNDPAAQLHALRQEIDERIEALLTEGGDSADLLAGAMRAGALGSGKRMRPLLLMLVARDLGCTSPGLIDVACAVEMVHAASLVLDDMPCMDDARLRRGKPAVHVQFGEDVAILAAIGLLSRAFCVLSSAADIPPAIRTRLVCTLSQTIGTQGLVRGQFLDLHGGQRSAEEIATTNELKTGVLLGVAVEMAAIVAQADEGVTQSLHAFALAAGQAFQIRDDFADSSDSAITGKDTGKDVGKATFINTLGHDEAQRRLAKYLRDAEKHLDDALGPHQDTRRFVGSLFQQARGHIRLVPEPIVARPGAESAAACLDARG